MHSLVSCTICSVLLNVMNLIFLGICIFSKEIVVNLLPVLVDIAVAWVVVLPVASVRSRVCLSVCLSDCLWQDNSLSCQHQSQWSYKRWYVLDMHWPCRWRIPERCASACLSVVKPVCASFKVSIFTDLNSLPKVWVGLS